MTFQTFPDYTALSDHTARHLAALLKRKPDALVCVASGDTPLGAYKAFVQLAQAGEVDTSRVTFVGLDEWLGMGPEDEGSCTWYLFRDLFGPLQLRPEQIVLLDAQAEDPAAACDRVNQYIAARGGLDLIIVGVGLNGHIAMNEPGTSFDTYAHVSDLHETTITVGQKYFNRPTPLRQGLTIGLRHVAEAGEAILLASGAKKAPVLKTALNGPVTEEFPASLFQRLEQGYVWADEAAAGSEA